MGVYLELVNFTQLFNHKTRPAVIVNDLSKATEDDKEAIQNLIYTRYATTYANDLLSNLPSCECGEIVGKYNLKVLCKECNTVVKPPLEQELEPLLWMRAPEGVADLINPIVWTMLNQRFKIQGFEVIRYLCDTNYTTPVKKPELIGMIDAKIERGYNYFVKNFYTIMDVLFSLKGFNKPRKGQRDPLKELIYGNPACMFSKFLPLPNKALLVIEETNVGTYVDPIITGAVDAINMMVAIDSGLASFSQRAKENRTIKTIAQISNFYDDLYRTTLAKKEGIFRKHAFGTRSHWSFRAVISSLTDRHDYDELHIPWGIGVSVLRIHLFNKLMRLGYTSVNAAKLLNEHAQKYHPLLDELFNTLIEETPYKGIPVVFQRNPSLERGSAQAMFITKVKTDVDIPTVSLSILSVGGFNADFDGDQLNGTLSLDLMTAEELKNLAPHKSTFDLNEPRKVSKNLSHPKPVVATFSNWMHSIRGESVDPDKYARMQELAEA